jgi:hypothetical protein
MNNENILWEFLDGNIRDDRAESAALLSDYFLSLEQAAGTAVFVGITSGFFGVELVTDGQVI